MVSSSPVLCWNWFCLKLVQTFNHSGEGFFKKEFNFLWKKQPFCFRRRKFRFRVWKRLHSPISLFWRTASYLDLHKLLYIRYCIFGIKNLFDRINWLKYKQWRCNAASPSKALLMCISIASYAGGKPDQNSSSSRFKYANRRLKKQWCDGSFTFLPGLLWFTEGFVQDRLIYTLASHKLWKT